MILRNRNLIATYVLAGIIFLLFTINTMWAGENDWQQGTWLRTKLTIPAESVTADLENFPLLIKLQMENFDFTAAREDGKDLRFTQDDNGFIPLSFERVSFDPEERRIPNFAVSTEEPIDSKTEFEELTVLYETSDDVGYTVDETNQYSEDGCGQFTSLGTSKAGYGQITFKHVDLDGHDYLSFYCQGSKLRNLGYPSVHIDDDEVWSIHKNTASDTTVVWQQVLIDISEYSGKHDITFRFNVGVTTAKDRIFRFDNVGLSITGFASGVAEYWVFLPEVQAETDTTLYMWHGMKATEDDLSGSDVWQDYGAVWHMENGPSHNLLDSTANGQNLAKAVNRGPTLSQNGIIGRSQYFDGNYDYAYRSTTENDSLDARDELTMQLWVNRGNIANYRYAISKNLNAGLADHQYGIEVGNEGIGNKTRVLLNGESYYEKDKYPPLSKWTQIVTTWDGSTVRLYQNGELLWSKAHTDTLPFKPNFSLGRRNGSTSNYWLGDMDEVRISKTARSAAWVNAEYLNVVNWDTFVQHGEATEVTFATDLPVITTLPPMADLDTESVTLTGMLAAPGATAPTVKLFWAEGEDGGEDTEAWDDEHSFGSFAVEGTFPTNLAFKVTGLTPGTLYTYRYYAVNSKGEQWGIPFSFTTFKIPVVDSISEAQSITWFSATFEAELSAGNPIPDIYYCANPLADGGTASLENWAQVIHVGTWLGNKTSLIDKLQPQTTYYVRLMASNVVGTTWSPARSFSTVAKPDKLLLDGNHLITGADDPLNFEEIPYTLSPTELGDRDWLFDFTRMGAQPTDVDLQSYTISSGPNPSASDSLRFDLNGANLSGDGSVAISTFAGRNLGRNSGDIEIQNVADIDCGRLDASADNTSVSDANVSNAGKVTIGTPGKRAGNLRIGGIWAGLRDWSFGPKGNGRDVSIYSSGNVVIADDSGIPQDIFTESYRLVSGKVTINHAGNLRVGEIRTRSIGQQTTDGRGEEVTLIGNGNRQAATGDCNVNAIMAYFGRTTYGAAVRSGPVTITGYKNVTVGDIKTYNASGASSSRSAGHIFITNIVDTITITGELDAEQRAFPTSSGTIELATLNGDIVIADLDLQKMLYITFDAGSSISRINGELANFDGTVEEPGTRLRAPAGQRIYYKPDENPDLDGLTYPLIAPDGVSAGGILKPEPALGTLLLIK